jgi:hypothetical protein
LLCTFENDDLVHQTKLLHCGQFSTIVSKYCINLNGYRDEILVDSPPVCPSLLIEYDFIDDQFQPTSGDIFTIEISSINVSSQARSLYCTN